jgi:hypothetical protein
MRAFFGLTSEYMLAVYEQFFYMKYVSNWSLVELYNLPVGLRNWFVERTIKQKEKEQEEIDKINKSRRR